MVLLLSTSACIIGSLIKSSFIAALKRVQVLALELVTVVVLLSAPGARFMRHNVSLLQLLLTELLLAMMLLVTSMDCDCDDDDDEEEEEL